MSRDEIDDKKEVKAANERRLKELLSINNRYIRTQRHLEEYANITELDNLKHAFKLQEERERRMENLKDIIVYGKHNDVNEADNIKRNLEYTEHYLDHHAPRMDKFTLDKTIEKQSHRKEQLESLD